MITPKIPPPQTNLSNSISCSDINYTQLYNSTKCCFQGALVAFFNFKMVIIFKMTPLYINIGYLNFKVYCIRQMGTIRESECSAYKLHRDKNYSGCLEIRKL